MKAFAVKHISDEHCSFSTVLSKAKKLPYSLTSKRLQAEEAAKGNYIYVIEVVREAGRTFYRLGYKFRSKEFHKRAGSALWDDKYQYKNTALPGELQYGMYFENPVEIQDEEFNSWFRKQTLGMAQIPLSLVGSLERMFSDPMTHAQVFKD